MLQTVSPSSHGTRPRLFWQGALMVLPVVLLAAVGLWSVVREIRMAEQESLRQCQQAAGTLARRLRSELGKR